MLRYPVPNSRKANVFSTNNIARMFEAANANRDRGANTVDPFFKVPNRTTEAVKIYNASGSDFDQYQPVFLRVPEIAVGDNVAEATGELTTRNQPIEAYDTTDVGTKSILAVTCEPIWSTSTGYATVRGTFWAKIYIPENLLWCNRCGFVTGAQSSQLNVSPQGEVQILWRDDIAENNEGWAFCSIKEAEHIILCGEASGDITTTLPGKVKVFEPPADRVFEVENVYLDWMHGGQKISDGKECLICYFPDEEKWRVIGAECEDPPSTAANARWAGDFDSNRTGGYISGEMVKDFNFLMVANTTTTDRAAPQPLDAPYYHFADDPTSQTGWNTQTANGLAFTGNSFVVDDAPIKVTGARVWLPSKPAGSPTMAMYQGIWDPDTELSETRFTVIPDTYAGDAWYTLTGSLWVPPGYRLDLGLLVENNGATPTEVFAHDWTGAGASPSANPTAGTWNHTANWNTIRINSEDSGSTDRKTLLDAIAVGDEIKIENSPDDGQYRRMLVDSTTYNATDDAHIIEVSTIEAVGRLNATDQTIARWTYSGNATFGEVSNYWSSNVPAWASSVSGWKNAPGMKADNDAYIADLQVQDYTFSADWDLMALSNFGV